MFYRPSVLIFAAVVLAGCGQKQAAVRPAELPPVRASVVQVTEVPFDVTVDITGSLVSNSQVEIKAQTIGRVLKFPKEEGDVLALHEPVIWVDNTNQKLQVRQAETAVQVAAAALERVKVNEGHNASEFERAKNLLASGGITDRDYRAAELAAHDSTSQTALAQAQLEQARAQLAQAQKLLNDTVIYAPVPGEMQRKYVNVGAYVEAPTLVFSIVDNNRLELESMVPTADLANIVSGQKVVFRVNAFPGVDFYGQVIEVNPAVQAETRSAKVRIRVNNQSRKLKAGMFAQGSILTGVESRAILIPASAVYRDDRSAKSSYLFVLDKGKATRRNVRIGRETGSQLEIVEGLRAGDVVVSQQSIEIAEGVRVEPLDNTAAAAKEN